MVGQIYARQLFYIIFLIIFPTAVLFLPAFSVGFALQGVWISILLAGVVGLFFAYILLSISKKYPDQNLIKIMEQVFGKYIGKIIGILLGFSTFYLTVLIMREFGVFMQITILNKTPLIVIIWMLLFISACAVRSGLVVIARLADLIFPIFLLALLIILPLLLPSIRTYYLTPVLGTGWEGIFKGSLPPLFWFSEIYILPLLLPFVKEKGQLNKAVYGSTLASIILLIITILIIIAGFGPHMTSRTKFPLFEATSLTHAFFIEQFDIFLVTIWIMGLFMKINIFYFATVYSFGQALNVKSYKSLVLPIGLLMGISSYTLYQNNVQFIRHLSGSGPLLLSLFSIILPLILFVITRFHRRKLT